MSLVRTCNMCGTVIEDDALKEGTGTEGIKDTMGTPDITLIVDGVTVIQYEDACDDCCARATINGRKYLGTISGHRKPKDKATESVATETEETESDG